MFPNINPPKTCLGIEKNTKIDNFLLVFVGRVVLPKFMNGTSFVYRWPEKKETQIGVR